MEGFLDKKIVWRAQVLEKKQIAKRTWEYTITCQQNDFTFLAGQYIWINLVDPAFPDEHGNRRAFSISSVPGTKTIQCIFRESHTGFKRSLLALNVGSELEIIGPFGSSFLMPEYEEGELVLIAGGVGVSPFLSLIRTHVANPAFQRNVVLVALNDTEEEIPYEQELKQLAQKHSNFIYVPVVGRKFVWEDVRTFVKYGGDHWFISGPQQMVDLVYGTLRKNDIPKGKMRFEHCFPTDQTILNDLFKKESLPLQNAREQISYQTLRTELIDKYTPWFIFLSAFFALASSVSHKLSHESSYVIDVAVVALCLFALLWFFVKKYRKQFALFILIFMAGVLLIALFNPSYSHDIALWLPFFPIAAFLFLEKQGWFVSFGFLGAVWIYVVLAYTGMIESKSTPIGLFQVGLSLLFTTALAGFYELVVSRSGIALNRQYDLSRIFEQAVQSSSNHIIFTDKNGVVQFVNRAAEKTTGFTTQEIIGNTPRLWGGLHSAQFYKDLWEKKKLGEVFIGELVNHRKTHERYDVLTHISPILNDQKRIIGYIGTEENITEIKEAESRAIKNKERFEQMANTISNVFRIISREDGRMLFVSKACENLWQKSAEDFYHDAEVWMQRIHKEDQERVRLAFVKTREDGTDYVLEYRIVRDDGIVRDIRDVGGVVKSGSEKGALIIGEARDITFEKDVDRVKSEFVSLASHQLRTPLTAIGWYSELLLDGSVGVLTKKQKECVKEVHEGNKRMIDLVNALLNTSRLDLGTFIIEPAMIDLVVLIKDVLKESQPDVKRKKIDIQEQYQANLPQLNVDEKLMRIVFQNLISNAIKYTPDKGQIHISLTTDGTMFKMFVKDSGFGIPKSQQGKIFSRLFRAENVVQKNIEGTGLGLYMVKSILEQAGGTVWFESEEGQGSTFYIELPLTGMKKKEGTRSLE